MHSHKIIVWCKFLLCVSLFQLNFFEADLKVVMDEISILNTTPTVLVYSIPDKIVCSIFYLFIFSLSGRFEARVR